MPMPTDSGLTGLTFSRPSLVKVQFADDCDISVIVKRFIKTGELPNLAVREPLAVQDATLFPEDFSEMQQQLINAKNLFEAEPLELREFFQHDIERYLEFRSMDDKARDAYIRDKFSGSLRQKYFPEFDPVPADPAPADPAPADPAPAS